MKILYLCQRLPFPPNKGEKIRTYHQIIHLAKKGHEITICAPLDTGTEMPQVDGFGDQQVQKIVRKKLASRIYRYLGGLLFNKPLSVSHFFSSGLLVEIDRLLESGEFTHVICSSSAMAEYVFNSRALRRSSDQPKLIMDFMDLDSDKWRQYSISTSVFSPMRWIYRREARLLSDYEQKVYYRFDISLFISSDEVDQFREYLGTDDKLRAIGNGIDCDQFTPLLRDRITPPPRFLFTGVMDYKPNIDAVIWFHSRIWPGLAERFPGAKFVIAGMNPVEAVRNLTTDPGVTITGFVDDILPYYHQADVFVAPIRIARGVQNKILQAFACGLPVVSTSLGASGIDCIDGMHLLIADSPEQFLKQIILLVEHPDRYKSQGLQALELIRTEYTWEMVLDDFISILQART